MALTAKLVQKQAQSLVMTPQLLQSIRLLQYDNQELAAFVAREVERNPLLEDKPTPDDPAAESAPKPDSSHEANGAETLPFARNSAPGTAAFDDNLGTTPENVFDADQPSGSLRGGESQESSWRDMSTVAGPDGDPIDLEAFCAAEQTLYDHLAAQAPLAFRDSGDLMIAREIISSLDSDGYLRVSLDLIAENLGAPAQRAESVLSIVQSFDPAGVAARDLAECLAIQLGEKDRCDPAMRLLLDNLDLLARRDYRALARICGVSEDEVVEMAGEIQELDPRPGRRFDTGPIQTAVPDVFIAPNPHGGWLIELNTDALPRVLVNRQYYAEVTRGCRNETEKSFMVDCLQSANWLAKSLDQRAQTILKVATEIVRRQDMFLLHGIEYLQPMNLRSVADAIAMHESTISRVTTNKFMMTPRGLFEFKYFFTAPISATAGDDMHSAEAVRHRIRQMIDAETAEDVLSDDMIVKNLRDAGIDIARRTVAKYRESMAIPSSVQRRRQKRTMSTRRAS